jgi:hypothetical protein
MGSNLILLWRDPSVNAAVAIIIGWQRVAGALSPIERLSERRRRAQSSKRAQSKGDRQIFITRKKLPHVTSPFDDDRPEFRAEADAASCDAADQHFARECCLLPLAGYDCASVCYR